MLTSTSAVWSIGAATASPYQTLYFVALGTAPQYVGVLVAYGTAVTILALLIGGYIADNWGRRKVIIIFSWVSVLSAFLYVAINSPILIIVPLTFGSLASVYTPAFNSLMMDSIEPSDRIRGFSVFNAINTIPSMFVPTVGGLLMYHFGILNGIKIAYLVSGTFGVIGVTIRTAKLGETYFVKPKEEKSFLHYIKSSLVNGIQGNFSFRKHCEKTAGLRDARWYWHRPDRPVRLDIRHRQSKDQSHRYSLVVDLAGAVTVALLLGIIFLIQRLGARKSVLVASVASPLSNVMFTQAKTMDELLEWGVTGAVATALQTPSLGSMQAEAIPIEDRGKILAMFSILPAMVSLPSQVGSWSSLHISFASDSFPTFDPALFVGRVHSIHNWTRKERKEPVSLRFGVRNGLF